MKDKPRLIQVGVGGWGFSWAEIASRSKEWDTVAYVDVNQDNLKQAAVNFGMSDSKCFITLGDAVGQVSAEAALVVVPPEVHREVAIMCLQAGLHVLVEKPLADSMEDAKAMIEEAERVNLNLMVSQNYRFKKAPLTVREVLRRGIVGKPGHAFVNFHKAPRFTTPYRLRMPYPLLCDMCIHHFDQMRAILGVDPVSVQARTWKPRWSWFEGDPVVSVIVEMKEGIWVTYNGSWVSRGWETTWDGDWRIECEEGEIHWAGNCVTVKPSVIYKTVFNEGLFEREGGALECELVNMPVEDREYTLHEFYRSITENKEPETSGKNNLKSLAMTLASIESAKRKGERIRIEDLV